MLDVWANFGLAGLVIGALFITLWKGFNDAVLKSLDMHQSERQQWRQSFERICLQFDTRQKETNELLRDLAAVMARNACQFKKPPQE